MDVSKYLELGFKNPEEMILYIDVFAGNCIKEKEPTSLEELLRNLEDENSISFVPKTKQNYDEEINKLIEMRKSHIIGEYYPYKDSCNTAHRYLLTRVNGLDKPSQDKFASYIGTSISQKEDNFRGVSRRDKAFVEVMSQGARMQDENIERRRQEKYQSMIDELDEYQQPPFRRK